MESAIFDVLTSTDRHSWAELKVMVERNTVNIIRVPLSKKNGHFRLPDFMVYWLYVASPVGLHGVTITAFHFCQSKSTFETVCGLWLFTTILFL